MADYPKNLDEVFPKDSAKEMLEYPSPELKADKEVVLEAGKKHDWELKPVSPELRNDKEAIKVACSVRNYLSESPEFFEPRELDRQADKDFLLSAVKPGEDFIAVKYNTKAEALDAVKQRGEALQLASPELKADKEVVLEAMKENYWAIQFASPELQRRFQGMIVSDIFSTLEKEVEMSKSSSVTSTGEKDFWDKDFNDILSTIEKNVENIKSSSEEIQKCLKDYKIPTQTQDLAL